MSFQYKSILRDCDEVLSIPIEQWDEQTRQAVQRLDPSVNSVLDGVAQGLTLAGTPGVMLGGVVSPSSALAQFMEKTTSEFSEGKKRIQGATEALFDQFLNRSSDHDSKIDDEANESRDLHRELPLNVYCRECGASMPFGSKFCGTCGTMISRDIGTESSDDQSMESDVERTNIEKDADLDTESVVDFREHSLNLDIDRALSDRTLYSRRLDRSESQRDVAFNREEHRSLSHERQSISEIDEERFEREKKSADLDRSTPETQTKRTGKQLFELSAFPARLFEELEVIAQFDSTLSDGANRLPIYRNVVSYVEDIVRYFLLHKIPDSIRAMVNEFAPSDEVLEEVSIAPDRMSMGRIAQWCRMVEDAICSDQESISIFYRSRMGRLDFFKNRSFSSMLNDFCPHRNDVVHTRESNRNPDEIVPLVFGKQFFHDWWHQECESLTPLTKALEGHVVLHQQYCNSGSTY